MIGTLKNICVRGIATAVPPQVEKNCKAVDFLGSRRCKKQIRLTGIEERHVSAINQKMSDLCYVAAKKLMEHLYWMPEDVKVIVLLTQNPNYVTPSTAFLLQKMLHIPQDCIAFDVNLGCSSFNVGLQIVSALLEQLPGNAKGICLQGDLAYNTIREEISPDTMAGNMLFGSAGSAIAIEKADGVGNIPFATFSDGTRYEAIIRRPNEGVHMEGEGIFNFSTNDVAASINDFCIQNDINGQNIDFYVFHQAQKLILDNLAAACNVTVEKELRSITKYGNTSGASIPLSICVNREMFVDRKNIRVFSCGFGVGLSWSMAYTMLEPQNILPVIMTDEVFEG